MIQVDKTVEVSKGETELIFLAKGINKPKSEKKKPKKDKKK